MERSANGSFNATPIKASGLTSPSFFEQYSGSRKIKVQESLRSLYVKNDNSFEMHGKTME